MAAFAATLGTEADQMIGGICYGDGKGSGLTVLCGGASGGVLRRLPGRDRKRTILRGLVSETKIQSWLQNFDIRHQEKLLALLQADKKIGLTMTKSCMLTPTKSVTALIGISREQIPVTGRECGD
ncbi:MAG: hypothetical protein ACLUUO_16060 [Sellimonas intestinalis]